MSTHYDILIIGAGACGLMAAHECISAGKSVALLEARDRIGGRVNTLNDPSFDGPVEGGAEFIHGRLPLTFQWLQKAGIEAVVADGSIWQKENNRLIEQEDFIEDEDRLDQKFRSITGDMPVAEFLKELSRESGTEELEPGLRRYVEGYYAADPAKASTQALKRELSAAEEEQYRVKGGYGPLLQFMCKEATGKGANLLLDQQVEKILWKKAKVEVQTSKAVFTATQLLVTVPLGVLQQEAIRFEPAIPLKTAAARTLGFGGVIKISLQFAQPFWEEKEFTGDKDLSDMAFVFSEENIPTWWTQQPRSSALLTGWLAGPAAYELGLLSPGQLTEQALASLARIFQQDVAVLQQLCTASRVHNWTTDPFTLGGYGYEVVNGKEARSVLLEPLEGTVFFAGEALEEGPRIGTVEAAFHTGLEAARQMIALG